MKVLRMVNVIAAEVLPKNRWFGRKCQGSSNAFYGFQLQQLVQRSVMMNNYKGCTSREELIDGGGINQCVVKNDEQRQQCSWLLQIDLHRFFLQKSTAVLLGVRWAAGSDRNGILIDEEGLNKGGNNAAYSGSCSFFVFYFCSNTFINITFSHSIIYCYNHLDFMLIATTKL